MTVALTETTGQALVQTLQTELGAEREMVDLLSEALSDLELASEDRGWRALSAEVDREFSRDGLTNVIRNCSVLAIASPTLRRGLQLRTGYVWGDGITVSARADDSAAQDVNAVVQAFWDDESNQNILTSPAAQQDLERRLATEGNIMFCLFTTPLTGRVEVRITPFEEITDTIANPEDREDVWFVYRTYSHSVLERGYSGQLRRRNEVRRVLHPMLGYRPATRDKTIDGLPVLWDQPMLHVRVNRVGHAKWGIPDAYSVLPWVRAYEGFLTDWAKLVKALSKFAWRLTGDRASKAKRAAQAMVTGMAGAAAAVPPPRGIPGPGGSEAGQVAAMGPGANLEAIPKSGATIDSGSGRPLAGLVAAGLGVSIVDLLADPGVTGARAVAETMDKATVLEFGGRRGVWTMALQRILGYVVDQSVKAPRGALRGTQGREPGSNRETITLAGDVERSVQVEWPALQDLDPAKLVKSIVAADTTGKLPPVETARMLMLALGVKDVDELLAPGGGLVDENGQWVDPMATAAAAAVAEHRRGGDPAAVLR